MSCLVSDVRKVHDISRALDLTDTVFVLFVFGEKLLLNHKMNKPLPCYVVLSLYSPSASKLSSKSLICPRLRLGQMFTFRTISQLRASITQYNIPRKCFIHKILFYFILYYIIQFFPEVEVTSGKYPHLVTDTEGDNCFSICPINERYGQFQF